MKFTVEYEMEKRGLPTLFKYQYFSIRSEQRKNWDYDKLEQYLLEYQLHVSNSVFQRYQDDFSVIEHLKDLEDSQSLFVVSNNQADRYEGKNQYIKCRIPMYVLNIFKNLFISTLVYDAEKKPIPQGESITFEFDTQNYTVNITDLSLYQPLNDPYFCYARNAVSTLSVEAIGLNQYTIEKDKEISDFYDRRKMSPWKERSKLEKENTLKDKAGVYMLFDENTHEIYVGKAIDLQTRIGQHGKNPNDPAYNFTHYRYSVISGEYYELLYLIENAAIHDVAWIIEMPTAQKYKPSLSKKFSLTDCKLVNSVEHQTRRQG